jgi:hypothetical protein
MTELNVGQLIDALSLCDRDLPVRFWDSGGSRIIFVEHSIFHEGGHIVYLHRHVPNLDKIDCEPIKSVSDRSPTFARVEYEDLDE